MSMETILVKEHEGWEIVYDMTWASMTVGELLEKLNDLDPDAHVRFVVKDREYEWYEAVPFDEVRVSDDGLQVLLMP